MEPGKSIRSFSFVLTILVLLLIPVATGFQFYLHSGERRCFTESVPANTKVLGEYTVSTGEGNMPVDISVRVPEENLNLYDKRNIDHGKFAFVVPFRESHGSWKAVAAEMHRKKLQRHIGDVFRKHAEGKPDGHRRRLLSARYGDRAEEIHRQSVHERQFDGHGKPKPPEHQASGQEPDIHDKLHHKWHHDSLHHRGEESHERQYRQKRDHNEDIDDDIDDFDIDDYDGIDDEELDDELAQQEAAHFKAKGTIDSASDAAKEAELFESRKFEICVSSVGEKGLRKRRVRLIIHKGETAHDYTRLAKREHMTQLEVSLRRVSEELHELMHELDKARQMEDSLRKMNENTNGRVMMLAIVSLVSLAAAGSYQAVYTKRFLKRKKIL